VCCHVPSMSVLVKAVPDRAYPLRPHLSLFLSSDLLPPPSSSPWPSAHLLMGNRRRCPTTAGLVSRVARPSLDTNASCCFRMIRGGRIGVVVVPRRAPSWCLTPASMSGGRHPERGPVTSSAPLAVLQSLSCRPYRHSREPSLPVFSNFPC
jgi:hypothetical protein